MKRKLFVLLSLVVLASMVLSACAPASPSPEAPAATQAPAQEAPATEEPVAEPPAGGAEETEAPVAEEPVAEPTKEPEPVVEEPVSDRKGGWLDKIIFSMIPDPQPAVAQLQADAVDMYAVAVEDATVYEGVRNDSELKYTNSYGSNNQLILNSVACTDTSLLNPFSSQKIREAMNWAVDRNYVSQEIMGGLGAPKYTALSSTFADYSRYADVMSAIESKYAYDFEKAKEVVDAEMPAMGAELNADGKWEYNGNPVKVIVLIRTEDNRLEIGNYFANQLEELGFTVERLEKNRIDAGPIWTGDPAACEFHVYTAGWISQAISRDDGNMFIQYNTGTMHTYPVFLAMNPSPELLEVSNKLFTNDFTTMEERAELFEQALNMSMEESWWGVWVNENVSFSPTRGNVQTAYDLAGGIASAQLWPYTIRFEGEEGGEMRIAQSGILVQPWNPIAGSNWTDDAMIQRAAMDWGGIYDPYTGLYLPKLLEKAEVVAQEGLPMSKTLDWVDLKFESEITVPEDAWVDWDAANQKFITAGEKYPEGITAKTKSTVYYIPELWDTTWHDGSPFTVADFVFTMIMNLDGGKPESKIFDEVLQSPVETYLTHFKGVRIVSTDPLVIETYDDQFMLDAELTITDWYPSRYNPGQSTNGMFGWHFMTPAIMAEENGELAFSTDKAQANEIEWTSFIAGPSLEIQAKYLEQASADGYIPFAPTLSEYITPEEAAARYENLQAWYEEHNHLFLGTGPYYVDEVFPVEQTITLSRYEDYLFPAAQWSSFEEPMMATVSVEGPLQVPAGQEVAFDVYVNYKDEAYPADAIDKVSYILFDANNQVVTTGDAEAVGDGLYEVVLSGDATGQLEAGATKLSVTVTSKRVSIPAFTNYEFVVTQ